MSADHYAALGLDPEATFAEIKRAYRRLVRVVHPDQGGTAEAFRIVQMAYEVLSDSARRSSYDRHRTSDHAAPPPPPPPPRGHGPGRDGRSYEEWRADYEQRRARERADERRRRAEEEERRASQQRRDAEERRRRAEEAQEAEWERAARAAEEAPRKAERERITEEARLASERAAERVRLAVARALAAREDALATQDPSYRSYAVARRRAGLGSQPQDPNTRVPPLIAGERIRRARAARNTVTLAGALVFLAVFAYVIATYDRPDLAGQRALIFFFAMPAVFFLTYWTFIWLDDQIPDSSSLTRGEVTLAADREAYVAAAESRAAASTRRSAAG